MVINQTSLGIGSGILAGALWGLVFLAPQLTAGFLPLQLSAGRYLAYGLVAAVLIAPSWRRLVRALSWKEWRALLWLAFTGNIIYYLFLATAVQEGGVRHAVPLRRLLPSLVLSAAGLACISWQSLSSAGVESLLGLGCALGALVSWTIYAVSNSRWLGRLQGVSGHDWNLAMGVVTGFEALVLAVPAFANGDAGHSSAQWLHFAGVVTSVAILCSILGNALWNVASRALPLTLMGQMIVFETLFASLYGFIWEERWPTGLEWAALLLLVGGVLACARAHARLENG